MSVVMIVRFRPESLDHALQVMASPSNAETLTRLTRLAKANGAVHHAFYTDPKDHFLVAVDEWESSDAFHKFFDNNDEISDIMEQAGVRQPPEITVLEHVEAPGTF